MPAAGRMGRVAFVHSSSSFVDGDSLPQNYEMHPPPNKNGSCVVSDLTTQLPVYDAAPQRPGTGRIAAGLVSTSRSTADTPAAPSPWAWDSVWPSRSAMVWASVLA